MPWPAPQRRRSGGRPPRAAVSTTRQRPRWCRRAALLAAARAARVRGPASGVGATSGGWQAESAHKGGRWSVLQPRTPAASTTGEPSAPLCRHRCCMRSESPGFLPRRNTARRAGSRVSGGRLRGVGHLRALPWCGVSLPRSRPAHRVTEQLPPGEHRALRLAQAARSNRRIALAGVAQPRSAPERPLDAGDGAARGAGGGGEETLCRLRAPWPAPTGGRGERRCRGAGCGGCDCRRGTAAQWRQRQRPRKQQRSPGH